MPRLTHMAILAGCCACLWAGITLAESGRIYGKLTTTDNDVFEGWIRWDKNEAFWDDIIDGVVEKDRYEGSEKRGRRYKESKKKYVEILGLTFGEGISWGGLSTSSESQLQFGHVSRLKRDGDGATLILKNGNEVIFTSSSDMGPAIREIVMLDVNEGQIYFDWDDIKSIDFMEEKSEPTDGLERLYGRVSTRRAGEFTGWVEWDVDEVFDKDDLDGDEDGGRKRKISFGRIAAIERNSSSSARVTTKDGKELVLRNSNDVNSENRGIVVKSAEFGRVKIGWSDFEKAAFLPVPKNQLPRFRDFDGGRKIRGVVTTEDGEDFAGELAWDNDEEYTWEHLNGEYKGVEMAIPFAVIMAIVKSSQRTAEVTLKNGTAYLLSGSNDVNEENKGIIVFRGKGDAEAIDWYDFAKATMK